MLALDIHTIRLSSIFYVLRYPLIFLFFFFNDTATTEIYTLSLHDALPICHAANVFLESCNNFALRIANDDPVRRRDRKSTRLNSSHDQISYAVFCLKKKKKEDTNNTYIEKLNMNELEHKTMTHDR